MTAIVLVLIASVSGHVQEPRVTIVQEGTPLEDTLVQQFKENGYNEVFIAATFRRGRSRFPVCYIAQGHNIQDAFLIVPKIKYLNGTVTVYQEYEDFFAFIRNRRSVVILFRSYGYFLLRIVTSRTQENILVNVGMRPSCENICPPSEQCALGDNELPRDIIKCPPNNECHLFSHEAAFDRDEAENLLSIPIGNAVIVRTCDDFIEAVYNKSEAKGGKVDVYFEGHGNKGLFNIGIFEAPVETGIVKKGSPCYNKICMELKNKINTLTLYSCSTAGGAVGKAFIQCLANCLNARVRAWEKTLYM